MKLRGTTATANDHLFYIVGISAIIIFFMMFIVPVSFAEEVKPRHVLIDYSEVCHSLQELNGVNPCYDLNEIKTLYPPLALKPSFQKMLDDSAKIERAPYQKSNWLQNHIFACVSKDYCDVFDHKDHSTLVYWYDLDPKARGYVDATITIHPNILHKSLDKSQNDIVFEDGNRYLEFDINQISIRSCRVVAYTPDVLPLEMGYLLQYLSNNCVDEKDLGYLAEPYREELKQTPYNPNESPAWLEIQRMEELKNKYRELRIGKD